MLNKKEYGRIGETVFYDTLDNGLQLAVVRKKDFKKSTAFLAVNYGGSDRRFLKDGKWVDTPAGVAHFLEHKMFDTESGENALTVLSGRGASANAFTASDMTAYHFESTDMFMQNLETLLSFVSVPYFTEESVAKERGIIAQEIRMVEDDPDHALYYGLLRSLFKKNPVRDAIAGTVESIEEITAGMLYDCHAQFYTPSNMALVVIGDHDPIRIRDAAARILPPWRPSPPERDYGGREGTKPYKTYTETKAEISAPIFLAGAKTKPELHGREGIRFELTAVLALNLLMGEASPLYSALYSEGLINETFSFDFEVTSGVSFLSFGGECREPERVFDRVLGEAERAVKEGIPREYFARRKKSALGDELRALNSFDNISYNVASGLFDGYDYFDTMPILQEVSEDDVLAFLSGYLTRDRMAVSLIKGQEDAENA